MLVCFDVFIVQTCLQTCQRPQKSVLLVHLHVTLVSSVHAASWSAVAYAWPQSTEALLKMHNPGREQHISALVSVQVAPRSRIDKDEQAMWWPQAGINAAAASHSPKRKVPWSVTKQSMKWREWLWMLMQPYHTRSNWPLLCHGTASTLQHIWLEKCQARPIMCQPLQKWVRNCRAESNSL